MTDGERHDKPEQAKKKGGELPPGFLPRFFLYGVLGHLVVGLIFLMIWAGSRAQ
ncbi:hypothetical protein ACFV5N_20870 [Streptomyces sp. NPDC059853]|uniref:hypothetical protein n=1 Tax=Streptomyces sp. NPDC059853 TaxID=3346973 RepID=UPI003668728F